MDTFPARPDLRAPAEHLKAVLAGVTEDDLRRRTPCTSYSVGDLLDHVVALTLAFRRAAEKARAEGGGPPPGSAGALHPEWRRVLPERIDALAAAWREPAAWTGTAEAGGVTMPAEVMGVVAMNELVIHGWDLARATGQPFSSDPETTRQVFNFLREAASEGGSDGLFGPVVHVPPEAPLLDRAVGLSGRDPAWSP